MITTERTRRLMSTTLVGGGLALALALSGCADDADPAPGSGSLSVSEKATAADDSAATPAAAASTADQDTDQDADQGTDAVPASKLLLTKSDLPSTYGVGATSELGSTEVPTKVRACLGLPDASDQVVESKVSPSFSYTDGGIASSAVRYKTQAAAEDDAKLLSAPGAEKCFRSAYLEQFNSSGSKASSVSVNIRPGTNDGPSNEAGIVSVSFVQDQGREGKPTITIGTYYFTGPKALTALTFVGFGNEFDQDLASTLIGTIAKRTASA